MNNYISIIGDYTPIIRILSVGICCIVFSKAISARTKEDVINVVISVVISFATLAWAM